MLLNHMINRKMISSVASWLSHVMHEEMDTNGDAFTSFSNDDRLDAFHFSIVHTRNVP